MFSVVGLTYSEGSSKEGFVCLKEVTLLVEGGGFFLLIPLEQIVFLLASCPICVFALLLLTRFRSERYHQRMEAHR